VCEVGKSAPHFLRFSASFPRPPLFGVWRKLTLAKWHVSSDQVQYARSFLFHGNFLFSWILFLFGLLATLCWLLRPIFFFLSRCFLFPFGRVPSSLSEAAEAFFPPLRADRWTFRFLSDKLCFLAFSCVFSPSGGRQPLVFPLCYDISGHRSSPSKNFPFSTLFSDRFLLCSTRFLLRAVGKRLVVPRSFWAIGI